MASTSETGHAVNLANFKVLIERCNEFGSAYNPSNSLISLTEMTNTFDSVSDLNEDYIVALEETKLPINNREILYNDLTKIVVRSFNIYLATQASHQSKKDAKGYMVKITGRNARIPKLDDGVTPDPNYVSRSQQSYVQKAYHFDMLVKLYKTDTNYAPNEAALKTAELEALLDSIRTANDTVGAVTANAITKRTARDHGLYDMGTGIIDLAYTCKKYVRGLFGAKSAEADSVNGIMFRRFLKMNAV